MKRMLFLVLFLCFFPSVVTTVGVAKTDIESEYYKKAAAIIFESIQDNSRLIEAIDILTEGIRKEPNNLALLRTRQNTYTQLGDFAAAKKDMEEILTYKPNFLEGHMAICMLSEAMGESRDVYMPCYKKVAKLYVGHKEKDIFTGYSDLTINTVVVQLMAECPEAEKNKHRYLEALDDSEGGQLYRKLLENFDRKQIIPQSRQTAQ